MRQSRSMPESPRTNTCWSLCRIPSTRPCLRKQASEPPLSLASVTPQEICRKQFGNTSLPDDFGNEPLPGSSTVLLSYGTKGFLRSRWTSSVRCAASSPRLYCADGAWRGSDRLKRYSMCGARRDRRRSFGQRFVLSATEGEPQAIEIYINDWSREQGQHLAHNQTSNDRDTQRTMQFGSGAPSQGQRQPA